MQDPPASRRKSLMSVPALRASPDVHETRRAHARYELNDRALIIDRDGREIEGWSLNISRGGVRLVAEALLEPGDLVDICIGDVVPADLGMRARVVWVQDERDGVIAGLAFMSSGAPSLRGLRPLAA